MWLGSGVAVVYAGSCSSDSAPSLGASIWCGPPKKRLFFLNYTLLGSPSAMVLLNVLVFTFYNSLTAQWINDEVKSASSLFWCQEALLLPSRVNLIEEMFMK